jgi:hypothetical protein
VVSFLFLPLPPGERAIGIHFDMRRGGPLSRSGRCEDGNDLPLPGLDAGLVSGIQEMLGSNLCRGFPQSL